MVGAAHLPEPAECAAGLGRRRDRECAAAAAAAAPQSWFGDFANTCNRNNNNNSLAPPSLSATGRHGFASVQAVRSFGGSPGVGEFGSPRAAGGGGGPAAAHHAGGGSGGVRPSSTDSTYRHPGGAVPAYFRGGGHGHGPAVAVGVGVGVGPGGGLPRCPPLAQNLGGRLSAVAMGPYGDTPAIAAQRAHPRSQLQQRYSPVMAMPPLSTHSGLSTSSMSSQVLAEGMKQVLQKKKDRADRALEFVGKARNDYRAGMKEEIESMKESHQELAQKQHDVSLKCEEVMEKQAEDAAAAYVKAGKIEHAEDMQIVWAVHNRLAEQEEKAMMVGHGGHEFCDDSAAAAWEDDAKPAAAKSVEGTEDVPADDSNGGPSPPSQPSAAVPPPVPRFAQNPTPAEGGSNYAPPADPSIQNDAAAAASSANRVDEVTYKEDDKVWYSKDVVTVFAGVVENVHSEDAPDLYYTTSAAGSELQTEGSKLRPRADRDAAFTGGGTIASGELRWLHENPGNPGNNAREVIVNGPPNEKQWYNFTVVGNGQNGTAHLNHLSKSAHAMVY
mmetsp:Transcript_31661/g.92843  ORF Transcript_31661/g.92843 Transcript_31661/m.92843 type:complete len:555 (+) Transcript_31661:226-1890(+)